MLKMTHCMHKPEAEGGLFSAHSMPTIKQEVNVVDDAEVYLVYGSNAPPWRSGYGRNRGYRRQDGVKQDGGGQGGAEGKLNPKNRYGDYLQCHGCGSFRHMVSDCPDAKQRSGEPSNDYRNSAVLYTGNIECYTSELTQEAENCAVLDSTCSSTVCGQPWMDKYPATVTRERGSP